MRKIIGIDPGSKGAISIINEDGTLFEVYDIPKVGNEFDLRRINSIISKYEIHYAAIEHQQVFGKEGIKTAFTIGLGYGILLMALEANNISYTEVRPQKWKKVLGLIQKDKSQSVRMAQKLFPTGVFVGPRGGIYDGRAESTLIAEYGRRERFQIKPETVGEFE